MIRQRIQVGRRQRFGVTAPNPTAALLSYWYGLSGACGAILLELYLHPRGRRVCELHSMLQSEGEHKIVKVYVCHLRYRLKEAFEGADVIETIDGPIPQGPNASCSMTRYRLRPEAVASVRECLEMAHEDLGAILAPKRRVAA